MDKAYNPKEFEDKIYQEWENQNLFNPDSREHSSADHFSIVLPPPNVTGTLHLGHASMLAIEDLFIRYKRMQGFDTLWMPGTDHAAIATQNVVEKKLLKEQNKTRHDFGREKFLQEVEKYVETTKDRIHLQTRKMGSSLDWSREAYTLDEVRSKAVKKVFKMMYDDGLVYRGYRIVNWCPRCHSTLADDEIEYKETTSKLYWIKYGPFTLATTRPETKLGDTAVAVHPDDKRYKHMIGKKYMIPGVLGEFEVVVVGDTAVDPEFGSGAVKVTPAHSMVDFEIAERNGVPLKKIINEDGRMMNNCGKYAGLTTLEAREAIVEDMQKMGLIEKVEENYENKLSVCYRCKYIIEPLPSDQWFIDVNKKIIIKDNKYFKKGASLKEVALRVVNDGEIKIIPDRFAKTYNHWMENLHDWCISRQIWFGHRIPVWYKYGQKIVVVRHGQALSNLQGLCDSKPENIENVLTDVGRSQVLKTAQELKGQQFDIIITSNFSRTRETAKILAEELGVPEIIEDARLGEVGMGEFNGNPEPGFTQFRLGDFEKWHKKNPKGIESFVELKTRVCSALDDIKEKYSDKKVLVVAHGDPIRIMQGYGRKIDDQDMFNLGYPANAGVVTIKLQSDQIKVSEDEVNESGWEQDSDTLDTWFSSGLWTFTTLLPKDWDGKSFDLPEVKRFHPTSVLETGYDILFFWVARMILMTTYVLGEVPFENVYLHGLIRDKEGDKMSKSKPETAIDPLEAGQKFGFDAVRLSLLIGNTAGNDIRLYDEKIEGYRNFVNKLWNVSRYIITGSEQTKFDLASFKNLSLADEWILSRFNRLKKDVIKYLDEYNFSTAGEELKEFTWNELADWYLEISKVKNADKNISGSILNYILQDLLKLWHPFVPYVTEVIWQQLNSERSIMIADWPKVDKQLISKKAEDNFAIIKEIVVKIRNLRAEYKVEPAKLVSAVVVGDENLIKDNEAIIKFLARVEEIEYAKEKPSQAVSSVISGMEIFLPLAELVDFEKEKIRLDKEKTNLEKYISGLSKKLTNKEFISNAPSQVVEIEKQKLVQAQENLDKIIQQIKS